MKRTILKKDLYRSYIKERKTIQAIQNEYRVGAAKIRKLLNTYKIKPRWGHNRKDTIPKSEIYIKYIIDKMTATKIASIYKISRRKVAQLLHTYNIDIRPSGKIEKNISKDELHLRYSTEKRSIHDVCGMYKICAATLYKLFKKYNIPIRKRGEEKIIDVTGKKFGSWTVIKRAEGKTKEGGGWDCVCACGARKVNRLYILRKGISKSCGKCNNFPLWKGAGDISGRYYCVVRNRARVKNLQFKISINYLWKLFLKQNRKCALTGIPLTFTRKAVDWGKKQTASLDRIDSHKGYIKGNVQWVHKYVNKMKLDRTAKEFIWWSKKVYEHSRTIVNKKV